MLVMLPVSEPSLHLSSWLATICRSASSSLVRRSNCNSWRERERGGGCIKTVRLFIYCFIYSRPEHYFGSVVSDTFFIVVKWTLQSVVGKQARYHRVCQLHTARHSWEESDMLRKNCDTKLKPSQMWHLLFCHQEKHSEQMKGHEGSGDLIYFHFFLHQECFYSNACLRNVWMCTLLL